MLTAPVYALSRPIKKIGPTPQQLEQMAQEKATSRLYQRSKGLHQKLKKDPLRYFATIMKDINQNYDMFEKKKPITDLSKASVEKEQKEMIVSTNDSFSANLKSKSPRTTVSQDGGLPQETIDSARSQTKEANNDTVGSSDNLNTWAQKATSPHDTVLLC